MDKHFIQIEHHIEISGLKVIVKWLGKVKLILI